MPDLLQPDVRQASRFQPSHLGAGERASLTPLPTEGMQ
jgi:hypothetical protein